MACSWKHCREEDTIRWLGYALCDGHWKAVCEAQETKANEVIQRRFLIRRADFSESQVEPVLDDGFEEPEQEWRRSTMAKVKAKKVSAKKSGGTRPVGKVSGLNVRQTWLQLFQQNARLPKAKKMTDEQIVKEMLKNFPGKNAQDYTPEGVHHVRRWCNQGNCDGNTYEFLRYDENGDVLVRRGGRPKGAKDSEPRVKRGTPIKGKFKIKKK